MVTDPIAVVGLLAGAVTAALALERRTKVVRALGAALVGILFGMLLSNLGVIPGASPAYDFLGGPVVYAAIVLSLLTVDVRSVVNAGPTMLGAFALGAAGSALGAVTGAFLLADAIGPETWKLAGQYTATYVGGGVNFAAVGAALETSGELFSAGIAADVVVTALWMAACLTVPVLFAARKRGAEGAALSTADADPTPDAPSGLHQTLRSSVTAIGLHDLGLMSVLVLGTLWASDALGAALAPVPGVLFLTTIALALAQLRPVRALRGAGVLGNYMLLVFLASNGASSVFANIVAIGPPIVYFALITVTVHGLVIFVLGSLAGFDLKTLAVASQANIGGPASAVALATARGYGDQLLPGVAVGLLGYAGGTYVGFAVAAVARSIVG
jgi:uncharacterized membrane protein